MSLAAAIDDYWADNHDPLTDLAARVLPMYHRRPHTDLLSDVLSDAVERAEAGEDVRIVVEMPPGFGKSSICSVAMPLWALQRNPDWETVLVSAEQSLATKWSRDCRHNITIGNVPGLALAEDSQAKTEWETTERGSLIARGVGGQITGRRARIMVIDDPVKNLAEAHSKVKREFLWDTWQSVLKTRLRPGSVVVLVMTRWHEDDLAARLLKTGDWQEVRLPAIAEENDPIGREPGEPLISPQVDETPEEALARWEQVKAEVGPYIWAALYQQRPSAPGGAIFRTDWWKEKPPPTKFDRMVTSWDLTFGSTLASGDYVVGQVWGQLGADCWLLDQVRGKWEFPDQLTQVKRLADNWPDATAHLIEIAANGASVIATLKPTLPGIIPIPTNKGSKEIRAIAVSPFVQAGNVHLPESAWWLDDFHAELAGFPTSAPHDDQVDALTQALDYLRVPVAGVVSANPTISRVPSNAGGWRGHS